MTESHTSIIEEEVAVLEAIFIHELDVGRNEKNEVTELVLQLHPSTGDNRDQQYVCMTLILGIPEKYPDEPPTIQIKNPRGIGEEELQSTLEAMLALCEDRKGEAILYELIELAKETLTEGNIPRCACMICLEHFEEGEMFRKTECYHYFHDVCLGRYVKHVRLEEPEVSIAHAKVEEKKLLCPVCREEIHYSEDSFPETPVEEKIIYYPSVEMLKQQAEMAVLLEKQRQRGGLIDLEAEKNKYLISSDDVVYLNPPRRTPDISQNISSDNLEDLESEKHESDNKGDTKSERGGSQSARRKGKVSKSGHRSYSDNEHKVNVKGKRESGENRYREAQYRNYYERDVYRNERQRTHYKGDNQRDGRKTRDKHDRASNTSQRTDKYDDYVNERKTSWESNKNIYSDRDEESSEKTKVEDKNEGSQSGVTLDADNCQSKGHESFKGMHRENVAEIESSNTVIAKRDTDSKMSGKNEDTKERKFNKYDKSFNAKRSQRRNYDSKDQTNYMYKTNDENKGAVESRNKVDRPYSGRSYGRGRGRHNFQHEKGEHKERDNEREIRNFKIDSKLSDLKASAETGQEKDFRMSEKHLTEKVESINNCEPLSKSFILKDTSDVFDIAGSGKGIRKTQGDAEGECKHNTDNTAEKSKKDIDGYIDKKSESKYSNERRYNKSRGREGDFHKNDYSEQFTEYASDNSNKRQHKNEDRFRDKKNEVRYSNNKTYNKSRSRHHDCYEKTDKCKQEESEKPRQARQNESLDDDKQRQDNVKEKLTELRSEKEHASAKNAATHNINDDGTSSTLSKLSISARPSAPPGFSVKAPPGF